MPDPTVDQIRDMLSDYCAEDRDCEYVTIHIDDSQQNSRLALVHGGGEMWLVTVEPATLVRVEVPEGDA